PPHHHYVISITLDDHEQLISTDVSEVVLPGGESSVVIENLMLPTDRPRVILVNHHDQTYAQVTFDQASLEAVTAYPIVDPNSTAIATVWSTLWTMVRHATLPAATFVRAAAKLSNSIYDVSLH